MVRLDNVHLFVFTSSDGSWDPNGHIDATFVRRARHAAARCHVLRARPRDHRRQPRRRPDHRGRRRQGARRRVPRHLPDAGEPRSRHPAADHHAHRVCPTPSSTRRPRIGAVLPSLQEFIGDAVIVGHNIGFDLAFLRHGFERTGRAPLTNPSIDTVALGPSTRPRRGARLSARDARVTLPSRPPTEPPGARRRPGHHRPAPPAHRAGERARRARARRPVRPRQARRPPAGREAQDDLRPAALARRVHVLRPPRPGPLRRQGDQPPPTCAELLRQRRPPQDRPDAARNAIGPPSRPSRPADRRSDRESAHRVAAPPVQPRRHPDREVLLRPPRHRVGVAATVDREEPCCVGRPPRPAAVADDGQPRDRRAPHRRSRSGAAPLASRGMAWRRSMRARARPRNSASPSARARARPTRRPTPKRSTRRSGRCRATAPRSSSGSRIACAPSPASNGSRTPP